MMLHRCLIALGSSLLCALSSYAHAQSACGLEVEVECAFAEVDSGDLTARVSGRLQPIGNQEYYGQLELTTMQADDPSSEQTQSLQVQGSVHTRNALLSDSTGFTLSLQATDEYWSEVRVGDDLYYTLCTSTPWIQAATGTDLTQLRGSAIFLPNPDGETYSLRFQVFNYGDVDFALDTERWFADVYGVNSRQLFRANRLLDWETGSPLTSIAPGRAAMVEMQVAGADFKRCSMITIELDPEHLLQTSTINPFSDDWETHLTPCLTWTTPLTADALGNVHVLDGAPPDIAANFDNISIGMFVSSNYVVRPDGNICANCHYASASNPYHPPVPQGYGSYPILQPSADLNGRTWDTLRNGDGLALHFLGAPKPAYLKRIIERWILDGMRGNEWVPPASRE